MLGRAPDNNEGAPEVAGGGGNDRRAAPPMWFAAAMSAPAETGGGRRAIERLMRPGSVAIIGASPSPGSLGGGVLANLARFGFSGTLHLVNPNRTEIDGRPCLASVEALPPGVDCAVLAIPRAGALEAVAACARRGVGGMIIYSAGFAELGGEGVALQAELARRARAAGMAIEGPNCLGMINYVDGVPLTFAPTFPAPHDVRAALGLVSQSGAMATVVRAALQARGIGLTFSISTGNEAVDGVEDFLEPLLADAQTRAVAMVVEQFRQPRRFLDLARRAREAGKPIVLLHPGRSAAARLSAETHTGAMTGDYDAMRTLVIAAGIALVETLEELIDLSELLIRCPAPPPGGTALITDSGAFRGMMLDYGAAIGLPLPPPAPETAAGLRAAMPDFVVATNPLDITAQALVDLDLYRKAMVPFLADPRYGSLVLAVILGNAATSRRKMPPIIAALAALQPAQPVIFAMMGEDAEVPQEFIDALRGLGVPFFRSPERALRALARLTEFAARPAPVAAPPSAAPAQRRLPAGTIPEYRSKTILAEAGIPVPRGQCVRTLAEAQAAAARIGFPVALKGQSAALSHKSEAGAVVLHLADAEALAAGWARLEGAVAGARPGLVLEGVLVEAMARPGVEVIIGARNDPAWGPVLLIGLGGIWAEALADRRLLPPGLSTEAIIGEFLGLKGAALLRGLRGAPPCDVAAAAAIVTRLDAVLRAAPEIAEVDLNPVVVHPEGEGALVLDAVIVAR